MTRLLRDVTDTHSIAGIAVQRINEYLRESYDCELEQASDEVLRHTLTNVLALIEVEECEPIPGKVTIKDPLAFTYDHIVKLKDEMLRVGPKTEAYIKDIEHAFMMAVDKLEDDLDPWLAT